MMKNVKLKKVIKNTVCRPLSLVNKIWPKDDSVILLYVSSGGIRHNLKPLLKYLIDNGYNQKYKIYCGIEDLKYRGEEAPNVRYIGKLEAARVLLSAAHVFYTAGQIPIKPGPGQSVIHLTHGAVYLKTMGLMSNINNGDEFYFTKMLVTCDLYKPIVKKSYNCGDDNLLLCNEPMTDIFYQEKIEDQANDKFILWLPTFRQSDLLGYDNSDNDKPLLIFDDNDYSELDAFLRDKNIHLVVKLHPAQTPKATDSSGLTHLHIYTDQQFRSEGLDVYKLMHRAHALIGDYSSAMVQYLLLDRPLAYVIPDLEAYREQRGFIFDNPLDYMPGDKIYRPAELYRFIDGLCRGEDPYREERERLRDTIHFYQDGEGCRRAVEASGLKL